MDLDLIKTSIHKVEVEVFNNIRLNVKRKIDLKTKVDFSDGDGSKFSLTFILKVKSSEIDCFVLAEYFFTYNGELSSDYVKNVIARTTAPAIAFPYLRSFIATLTTNCGIGAIHLPLMNFYKIQESSNVSF